MLRLISSCGDSYQTSRMPRLIRVSAWRTGHCLFFLFFFFRARASQRKVRLTGQKA